MSKILPVLVLCTRLHSHVSHNYCLLSQWQRSTSWCVVVSANMLIAHLVHLCLCVQVHPCIYTQICVYAYTEMTMLSSVCVYMFVCVCVRSVIKTDRWSLPLILREHIKSHSLLSWSNLTLLSRAALDTQTQTHTHSWAFSGCSGRVIKSRYKRIRSINIPLFHFTTCVLTFVKLALKQKVHGDVISFAGSWSYTKELDKLTFLPNDGARWKIRESTKLWQFILRQIWMSEPNSVVIHAIVVETFC